MSRKPCVRQLQGWNTGRCFPEAEKCGKNQVLRAGDCNSQGGRSERQPNTSRPTTLQGIKLCFFPIFPENTENKNILTKRVKPKHFCS